jgi:hypothetical protein
VESFWDDENESCQALGRLLAARRWEPGPTRNHCRSYLLACGNRWRACVVSGLLNERRSTLGFENATFAGTRAPLGPWTRIGETSAELRGRALARRLSRRAPDDKEGFHGGSVESAVYLLDWKRRTGGDAEAYLRAAREAEEDRAAERDREAAFEDRGAGQERGIAEKVRKGTWLEGAIRCLLDERRRELSRSVTCAGTRAPLGPWARLGESWDDMPEGLRQQLLWRASDDEPGIDPRRAREFAEYVKSGSRLCDYVSLAREAEAARQSEAAVGHRRAQARREFAVTTQG